MDEYADGRDGRGEDPMLAFLVSDLGCWYGPDGVSDDHGVSCSIGDCERERGGGVV